jgi:hypothetical protein
MPRAGHRPTHFHEVANVNCDYCRKLVADTADAGHRHASDGRGTPEKLRTETLKHIPHRPSVSAPSRPFPSSARPAPQ